jgi:threonylcarbamoyladenosine tRNA methylthiotransferase MtaB
MCRPYRLSGYRFIVELIRRRLPNAAIGSDVIVGFPGETDKDFQIMSSYLKKSPITYLHVFPYSDRPGTPSTTIGDKVSSAVIRDRARTIREIGVGLTRRFRHSQIGKILDGITLKGGRQVITDNYLKVSVEPGQPGNAWVAVKITEAGDTLRGKIVNKVIN